MMHLIYITLPNGRHNLLEFQPASGATALAPVRKGRAPARATGTARKHSSAEGDLTTAPTAVLEVRMEREHLINSAKTGDPV